MLPITALAVSPLIYDYIDPTTIMESQAGGQDTGGQETEERIENEVNETNSKLCMCPLILSANSFCCR